MVVRPISWRLGSPVESTEPVTILKNEMVRGPLCFCFEVRIALPILRLEIWELLSKLRSVTLPAKLAMLKVMSISSSDCSASAHGNSRAAIRLRLPGGLAYPGLPFAKS